MPLGDIERQRAIDSRPIQVQSWNREIVRVYLSCRQEVVASMHGLHYVGISAGELVVVCRVLGLRCTQEILHGVRIMASAFARVVSDKLRAEADRSARSRPTRGR